ncbi:hypothetical protein HPB52_004941 [Rhipicephalus sanguineus]|uniref:Uncharacterized protein n=1 Tax=Rhipicephalus sanguineus TaxID=34632 RepID=A0A9D4PC83_RHISA|nr:hypothetical protein HPB52_004941 [Rhipicephalus sanguineus]
MSKAVSVKELICTVGATAIFEQMIPPDGLCDYVYYTNVVVIKGNLHAIEISRSWEAFKNALATFNTTSGGIGFDVRYVTVADLDATLEDKSLKDLASRNVKHYGVLNVLDTASKVKGVFAKAKGLLRASGACFSRRLPPGFPGVMLRLGHGLRDYAPHSALPKLIAGATLSHSVADTVIAYSSVGWIESEDECLAHPPVFWDRGVLPHGDRAPDLCMPLRMRSTNLRNGMSVLVLNTHLGDFRTESPCQNNVDRLDPFDRVRLIKQQLSIP